MVNSEIEAKEIINEEQDKGKEEEKENSSNITLRSLRSRNGKTPIYNFRLREKKCYSRKRERPRWYNQTFLMFLALREAKKPLPRGELIQRTLDLDEKYSREMGLPKCFHGKTPVNTASMILTVNRDKLFISEKPPGSRSLIFKLAFEPCNLDKAIEYYNNWMKELKGDWWWTFSKKRNYGFEIEESTLKDNSEDKNTNDETMKKDNNNNNTMKEQIDIKNKRKRKYKNSNEKRKKNKTSQNVQNQNEENSELLNSEGLKNDNIKNNEEIEIKEDIDNKEKIIKSEIEIKTEDNDKNNIKEINNNVNVKEEEEEEFIPTSLDQIVA